MHYVFKIDKDNAQVFDMFRKEWVDITRSLLKIFGLKLTNIIIKPSPSKRGYHIWVHAEGSKKLKNKDFVRIQYLLGDDETRSYLALARIERGIKHWNKLFSKVVWKRDQKYQLEKCLNLLDKERLTKKEREYIKDYLERLFYSLREIVDKINSIKGKKK